MRPSSPHLLADQEVQLVEAHGRALLRYAANTVKLNLRISMATYAGAFDQFMGFKERLEEIFQRPGDLLTHKRFRNPLFQEQVEKSKTLIYAA